MRLQISLWLTPIVLISLLLSTPSHAFSQQQAAKKPSVSPSPPGRFFSSHVSSSSTIKNNNNNDKNNLVTLTYLEINGWLLTTSGCTLLIDPLLEGPLDFGIPNLYQGKKRVLPLTGLVEALPPIDGIVLTQGLDDHAHVETLQKMYQLDPTIPIVAPPSAKRALKTSGFYKHQRGFAKRDRQHRQQQPANQIRFLNHRDETTIPSRSDTHNSDNNPDSSLVRIRATEGALVGPPWQRRENGYLIQCNDSSSKRSSSPSSSSSTSSIYIEPHVEFNPRELESLGPVDVVISPISGQTLPAFELVHGPKDTMRLLELLRPNYIVPMQNGDVDGEGPVSKLVSEVGSAEEFQKLLQLPASSSSSDWKPQLVGVYPGRDIQLSL